MCFKPDTALHLAVMPDLLVTMSGLPCWFFLKLKKKKQTKTECSWELKWKSNPILNREQNFNKEMNQEIMTEQLKYKDY